MADNETIKKTVRSRVRNLTLMKRFYRISKKMWECSEAPTVDAGSQGTYPVKKGDVLYDYTNKDVYICSTAPTTDDAGAFVKITD
jgi:hypothetical protein